MGSMLHGQFGQNAPQPVVTALNTETESVMRLNTEVNHVQYSALQRKREAVFSGNAQVNDSVSSHSLFSKY